MKKLTILSAIFTLLPFITWSLLASLIDSVSYNLYLQILDYSQIDIVSLLGLFLIFFPMISWVIAIILGIKSRRLEKKFLSLLLTVLSTFFLFLYISLLFI